MEGEFAEMGKLIGAGLACTGMGGAAVGVGHVVGNYLSGALKIQTLLQVKLQPCLLELLLLKL